MSAATMEAAERIRVDKSLIAKAIMWGRIDLAREYAVDLAQTRDGLLTMAELLVVLSSRPGAAASPVTAFGPGREEPADIVRAPSPACAVSAEPGTK